MKEVISDKNSCEAENTTIRAALKQARKELSAAQKEIFSLELVVNTTAEAQAKKDDDEKKRVHELALAEIKVRQEEKKSVATKASTETKKAAKTKEKEDAEWVKSPFQHLLFPA